MDAVYIFFLRSQGQESLYTWTNTDMREGVYSHHSYHLYLLNKRGNAHIHVIYC